MQHKPLQSLPEDLLPEYSFNEMPAWPFLLTLWFGALLTAMTLRALSNFHYDALFTYAAQGEQIEHHSCYIEIVL